MAREVELACRKCRREGVRLLLKGEKCNGANCVMVKRNYTPGQHGLNRRRGKASDYSLQLREKQKVKRTYGVLEKQFRNYFEKADRKQGVTGEILLQLLEARLDNTVYRLGFATSRRQARQLVSHGHFAVNGRKVDVPSFNLRPGDKIEVVKGSAKNSYFADTLPEIAKNAIVPAWLKVDPKKVSGEFTAYPTREELDPEIQEQLIVELYSK
jgi:small subunit ribosomal protein S4